ncbi:alpha/beta-hydrolase [Ascobolus immersus RN42]|uniref:Alpha/beta-hydrolase n=1 Tax=Ascobolus immersus RN42 TaxID=1160509 RepID=A0A3N4IH38_ASCIM|nr:alpha/beta-hydrolase [Ascobolus immersus RN42]
MMPSSYLARFFTNVLASLQTLQCNPLTINPTASALHHRHIFYIPGTYQPSSGIGNDFAGTIMSSQLYVERLTPACSSPSKPSIILVHGASQLGTNFLNAPDGRPGYSDFFLNKGYTVYIVDQPFTGRSGAPVGKDKDVFVFTTEIASGLFSTVAPENSTLPKWPQQRLQTQWPGTGLQGDDFFDHYYASNHKWNVDQEQQEPIASAQLIKLINNIEGDVMLIAHSQGAPIAYKVVNQVGNRLKGLVLMDPLASVFEDSFIGYPLARPYPRKYSLTETELLFDPPVENVIEDLYLKKVRVGEDTPGKAGCWQQGEPVRQLVGLRDVPTLVVTAEAGWNAVYDHCTVGFMRQAGVEVEHLKLAEVGVRGNGHMFFLEENNWDSFEMIENWIGRL